MSVQARLKEAMAGYSIARFSREHGYQRRTLYKWLEDGAEPPIKFLRDVAEKFGVSLDWLIKGRGPKSSLPVGQRSSGRLIRVREVKGRPPQPLSEREARRVAEDEGLYVPLGREDKEALELARGLSGLKKKHPEVFSMIESVVGTLKEKPRGRRRKKR